MPSCFTLADRNVRLHKLNATFFWAESRAGQDSPHQVSAGVVTCHPVGSLEGLWTSCSVEKSNKDTAHLTTLSQAIWQERFPLDLTRPTFQISGIFIFFSSPCAFYTSWRSFLQWGHSLLVGKNRTGVENAALTHPGGAYRPLVRAEAKRKW